MLARRLTGWVGRAHPSAATRRIRTAALAPAAALTLALGAEARVTELVLEEVLMDAWRRVAPRRLVKEHDEKARKA